LPGAGEGKKEFLFNGYRIYVGDNEKVLDIHNCDDYATLDCI